MSRLGKLFTSAIILNGINFALLTLLLNHLPLLAVIILMFLVPIVINGFINYLFFLDSHGSYRFINYVLPIFSLIAYLIFGWVTRVNGSWADFARQYTTQSGRTEIEIANSPLNFYGLLIIIVIYFAVHFLIVQVIKRRGHHGGARS